jgi:hypothetical protein
MVSVCVGSAWKILPITAHSLCLSICDDKQGRAGQGGQGTGGEGPGGGGGGGPASNQTKIQFKKKYIFSIEHIKKTRIFLKNF